VALGDMVTTVAAWRLDRIQINGRYSRMQIRSGDLARLRQAVLHAMGMGEWKPEEVRVKVAVAKSQG
jgi:hypothetical protein